MGMYIQDITPTMLKQLPNQTCEVLNKIIKEINTPRVVSIKQTTTKEGNKAIAIKMSDGSSETIELA